MKLPKLLRTASSKKSKKWKGIEIETVPEIVPAPGHYFEEQNNLNLPPPAPSDHVAESSLVPSDPQESPSSSISSNGLPFSTVIPLKPPAASERHSSSSSDYGHSYRSRSSSVPSVYRGSDPGFPYPLLYEHIEAKQNDHRSLDRQSSGSWGYPPSPECGPSAPGTPGGIGNKKRAVRPRRIKGASFSLRSEARLTMFLFVIPLSLPITGCLGLYPRALPQLISAVNPNVNANVQARTNLASTV